MGFLGGYFQGGQVFLGLEYLDRGSLEDLIQQYGAVDEAVLRSIARQSLLGLRVLHERHMVGCGDTVWGECCSGSRWNIG